MVNIYTSVLLADMDFRVVHVCAACRFPVHHFSDEWSIAYMHPVGLAGPDYPIFSKVKNVSFLSHVFVGLHCRQSAAMHFPALKYTQTAYGTLLVR